jgi:hypothetical protein
LRRGRRQRLSGRPATRKAAPVARGVIARRSWNAGNCAVWVPSRAAIARTSRCRVTTTRTRRSCILPPEVD